MNTVYHLGLFMLSLLSHANAATGFSAAAQTELVKAHNAWRSQVNVPALSWSAELAERAQRYADDLAENQQCRPIHSATAHLGENLYWASPLRYSDGRTVVQAVSPSQAVTAWGNEKAHYHPASNRCIAGKECGHYTQLVWGSTTSLGCGKALCADKAQIWVCHYLPAGNYSGQKPY